MEPGHAFVGIDLRRSANDLFVVRASSPSNRVFFRLSGCALVSELTLPTITEDPNQDTKRRETGLEV